MMSKITFKEVKEAREAALELLTEPNTLGTLEGGVKAGKEKQTKTDEKSKERTPMTTDTKPLSARLRAWPRQAPTAEELVAAIVADCIEAADTLDAQAALLSEAAEALRPNTAHTSIRDLLSRIEAVK